MKMRVLPSVAALLLFAWCKHSNAQTIPSDDADAVSSLLSDSRPAQHESSEGVAGLQAVFGSHLGVSNPSGLSSAKGLLEALNSDISSGVSSGTLESELDIHSSTTTLTRSVDTSEDPQDQTEQDKSIELAPLWWLGVIIGLAGSCFSALGDNIIRKSFSYADKTRSRHWPMFILGWFSTSVINTASTFAAYHFTTMAILAPCGGLHIVFAVIFAVLINQEPFGARDATATAIILAGVVGALSVGPKNDPNQSIDEIYLNFGRVPFIVFSVFITAVGCVAAHGLYAGRASGVPQGRMPRLCVPVLSGLFGAYTNLAVKILIAFFGNTSGAFDAFTLPSHSKTYLIVLLLIVCALGQVYLLNSALAEFEAVSVIPVYSCTLITMSGAVSMVFFEEWYIETWRLVLFPTFILSAVAGIYVLSMRDMPKSEPAVYDQFDKPIAPKKNDERERDSEAVA